MIDIEAEEGISLMEAIRMAGLNELLAICGGQCICATCHVYVENAPDPQCMQATPEELDLLELSDQYQPNSRLSCQIEIGPELQGARVKIV